MSFTPWRRALDAVLLGRYRPRRARGLWQRRPRGYVPCIEVLEDRLTPAAIITVNSFLDLDTRDSVLTFREALAINNRTLDVSTLTLDEQQQVIGAPTAADADTINFNIGSGVQTIQLQSDLPAITDSVVIDGTSQPGFSGTPLIVLRGPSVSSAGGLLTILAGGSTVRSLVINNSPTAGVFLFGLGGNRIIDNVIAFNAASGVNVNSGDRHAILGNSIFSNGGLGIDLGNVGVTNNDAGDGDQGANNLQNFPILTSASVTGSGLQVDGTFNGAAIAALRLEFFISDIPDATGFGEGQTFIGSMDITTDAAGNATFPFVTGAVPAGKFITATATDVALNTSEFSAFLLSPNNPPVLDPIGNQTVEEGRTLTFTAIATDLDSPPQKLTFSLIGAPPGAAIDPTTGRFIYTPSESDGGKTITFTVRVTDDGNPNRSDQQQVTVAVKDTNQPPVLDPIGDQFVDEETLLTFQATASDPDLPANNLKFDIFNAPPGSLFDPATSIFQWTPTEADGPGVYTVTIRVTDDGNPNLFDEETFNIFVREVNRPPVLDPIPDQIIDEETLLTFTATATDPDVPANPLTFNLINAPARAGIDPNTGVFTWIPTEAQGPGVYFVTVRVTEVGGGSSEGVSILALFDEQQVKITVREVNRPPVLAPIPDRVVLLGTLINVTATATDPDLPPNTLTFSLDDAPNGATIDPVTGAIAWTADQGLGTFNFRVRVTDDGNPNLSDTTDFTVTVKNPPPVPTPTNNGSDVLIALVRSSGSTPFTPVPFFQALSLLAPPDVPAFRPTRFEAPFTPLVGMSASVAQEVLGEISGHVFLDLNGNGKQDDGEPGLRGQRVFLDQNDNGIPDESEPTVESDGNGRYHFPGLQLTRYRVRQDLRNRRIIQTEPEKNAAHEIELTIDINSIPNVDFGAKLLPATAAAPSDYATPAPASPVRTVPDSPAPRDGERPMGPARNGSPDNKGDTPKPPPPREE